MPWECKACQQTVPLDDIACPSCGAVKTSWTLLQDKTRTFTLSKRKKLEVILRHALRTQFVDAGPWSEVEVNERLKILTDDVASIRRGFIDRTDSLRFVVAHQNPPCPSPRGPHRPWPDTRPSRNHRDHRCPTRKQPAKYRPSH